MWDLHGESFKILIQEIENVTPVFLDKMTQNVHLSQIFYEFNTFPVKIWASFSGQAQEVFSKIFFWNSTDSWLAKSSLRKMREDQDFS